jgi:hypothetical protein
LGCVIGAAFTLSENLSVSKIENDNAVVFQDAAEL